MKFSIKFLLIALTFTLPCCTAEKGSFAIAKSAPIEIPEHLLEYEKNSIRVFQETSDSVVHVSTHLFRRDFFSFDVSKVRAGEGTGFVWDDKGHFVTNFHVIQRSNSVTIGFKNGKTLEAKIVGVEPRKDIAVLKVNPVPKGLKPIRLGDSSKIIVGQKAIAIGNPYGLDQTLTIGTISALGRKFPSQIQGVNIRDMIQTDASINPGNSGGPLLDSTGKMLGMNTAIISRTGSSAGIGFAVPSNAIKRIVNQIIQYGKVIQPSIGVHLLDASIAAQLGIKGAIIGEIIKGTPAQKAGLSGTRRDKSGNIILGDVIFSLDGKIIKSYDDIYNFLERKKVGDEIEIIFLRSESNGKQSKKKTKLHLYNPDSQF